MDYLEIEQIDLTDSEMLDVIREKMADGWALSEYKWADGIKSWVFERPKNTNKQIRQHHEKIEHLTERFGLE